MIRRQIRRRWPELGLLAALLLAAWLGVGLVRVAGVALAAGVLVFGIRRRRWVELALLAALGLVGWLAATIAGPGVNAWFIRSAAVVLAGGVLAFAIRRRLGDVVRAVANLVVILTVTVVATLVVDLGPWFREWAERDASKQIERPLHIERLGIHLASGRFLVENLLIEGKNPGDRPFFTAKQISVDLPWWEVIRSRRLLFESIEMSDWHMLVEKRGDWNNFIHIPGRGRPPGPKRPFSTLLDYVHAGRGNFTYIDHGSWTTTAANLDIVVDRSTGKYLGRGSATNGGVQIRTYLPMRMDVRFTFEVKGTDIDFDRIELHTDNSHSVLTGKVQLGRWPEQTYQVQSRVDLWRSREIFFEREKWRSRGEAVFTGSYHIPQKGDFELKGEFKSARAWVNQFAFPELRGTVVWRPRSLEVLEASSRFYDGRTAFRYRLAPISTPQPSIAWFDARYEGVDLARFGEALAVKGIRMEGRAAGRNVMEWPLGGWARLRGEGVVDVTPPPGVTLLGPEPADTEQAIHDEPRPYGPEPFLAQRPRPTPMGGRFVYRLEPDWLRVGPSFLATERTYVSFEGETAYGERSRFPFRARSADWQESDRLLASIITAFGSPTGVVPVGGHGEVSGVMLGSVRSPRVEGRFDGSAVRAWDVVWGRGRGDIVVENGYVDVKGGRITDGESEITAEGRFSLGYPRRDGGDELDARVAIKNRPLRDLRHAFELDDYPIDGKVSGEFRLIGRYAGPHGYGAMTITEGSAWGESFDSATSPLTFEGTGVRLAKAEIRKSTGVVEGAAHVAWEGSYQFEAHVQRGIPVESIVLMQYPNAPLTGVLHFQASGNSTFLSPRYEARGRIEDLFVKDEGIGLAKGILNVRERMLTLNVEAGSSRIDISGVGSIEINDTMDADLTFRVRNTSLDPYLRVFDPRLSPFNRMVAGGTVRVVGQLYNPERLFAEARIEDLDLTLFDYKLRNSGPIRIAFDRNTVLIDPKETFRLEGEDTKLEVTGILDDQGHAIDFAHDRIAVKATGDSNMAVLQGFFRDMNSSGRAELAGTIQGPIAKPVFSGSATITDGRIRYGRMPHSIQAINGRIGFSADGITMDDVTAQVANGRVRFGGGISLSGYVPDRLTLTASGQNMDLRYPEGMRSLVDADLDLVGTFAAPTLRGTVFVKDAVWRKRIEISPGLIELASGLSLGGEPSAGPSGSLPLRFDVQVVARSALRIDNNLVQLVASGDVGVRGDYEHPVILGSVDIERGEVLLEGKRYLVTHGRLEFLNPTRIEPVIDIAAQTRVRAPGQTYTVDLRLSGTMKRLDSQLSSEPPLPTVEILTLLFGGEPANTQDAELRDLQRTQLQGSLGVSRLEQALVGAFSGNVTRAVEQAFRLDTVQLTPSLFDPYKSIDPTARLTVGKRISNRVYLTLARSLNRADQLVLLEFDQNDRLSWVFSRNEDDTYALDVRVRHVF